MIARRYIIKEDGETEVLFNEKCLCGNPELTIEKENSEFATCWLCLRVRRIMTIPVKEGICVMWGDYFNPYFMETAAGQFINQFIEHLPADRYPRPKDFNMGESA